MSNRDRLSIVFFAAGLSLSVFGVAVGAPRFLTLAGLFTIALAVRYRKRPPVWNYLAFVVLAFVIVFLVSSTSPLIGAIPLMLSYVLSYIDEQRQKRSVLPVAALQPGSQAEPGTTRDTGPTASMGMRERQKCDPSELSGAASMTKTVGENILQNCAACGGGRVTSGRLNGGEVGMGFELSEYNWDYWLALSSVPHDIPIRAEGVRLCLDCGKVTASMSVDVEEAHRVLSKWGSDALKSRLNGGGKAI